MPVTIKHCSVCNDATIYLPDEVGGFIDDEPHGTSGSLAGAAFDEIGWAACRSSDLIRRQLAHLRAFGRELPEPDDYATVALPSTNPRIAMIAARHALTIETEVDAGYRRIGPRTCLHGHNLDTNRASYKVKSGRTVYACRECERANSRRYLRKQKVTQ